MARLRESGEDKLRALEATMSFLGGAAAPAAAAAATTTYSNNVDYVNSSNNNNNHIGDDDIKYDGYDENGYDENDAAGGNPNDASTPVWAKTPPPRAQSHHMGNPPTADRNGNGGRIDGVGSGSVGGDGGGWGASISPLAESASLFQPDRGEERRARTIWDAALRQSSSGAAGAEAADCLPAVYPPVTPAAGDGNAIRNGDGAVGAKGGNGMEKWRAIQAWASVDSVEAASQGRPAGSFQDETSDGSSHPQQRSNHHHHHSRHHGGTYEETPSANSPQQEQQQRASRGGGRQGAAHVRASLPALPESLSPISQVAEPPVHEAMVGACALFHPPCWRECS
jgi:hypothetical protein